MNRVLAISGGMDSMLLFFMYLKGFPDEIVVAHFDHGMRPSSKDDAEFVRRICEENHVPFFLGEGHLGPDASEAEAREARYAFLESVAKKVGGHIVTAHHVDDLVESVAINLIRGTGWRGLAVLSREDIERPFINEDMPLGKYDIQFLAAREGVVFRQDPTNYEEKYLRNRIRDEIYEGFDTGMYMEMLHLHHEQLIIKKRIDAIIERMLPEDGRYERAWFAVDGPLGANQGKVAYEFLRAAFKKAGISATRPQIMDFLLAVKMYQPGKKFNLPGGRLVELKKDHFVL